MSYYGRVRRLPAAVVVAALFAPGIAGAHLGLEYPASRYGPDVLKRGPCGKVGGARTQNVTVLRPGATIDIVFDEFVEHPSHYRVAFDEDGVDDFVDPGSQTDFYSNDAVLLDDIADSPERVQTITVTLPDVECDNCTLQVIQVMYDKPPFGDGNDMYYQCADLVLSRNDPVTPPPPDAGVNADPTPPATSEGGCTMASGGPGGAGGWAALAFFGALARRRRHARRT